MKRLTSLALVALILASALWSCGRTILTPPRCLSVVIDTAWGYSTTRPDSVAVIYTRCDAWEGEGEK